MIGLTNSQKKLQAPMAGADGLPLVFRGRTTPGAVFGINTQNAARTQRIPLLAAKELDAEGAPLRAATETETNTRGAKPQTTNRHRQADPAEPLPLAAHGRLGHHPCHHHLHASSGAEG
jgi:hypothetical protein